MNVTVTLPYIDISDIEALIVRVGFMCLRLSEEFELEELASFSYESPFVLEEESFPEVEFLVLFEPEVEEELLVEESKLALAFAAAAASASGSTIVIER